ncbi:MAG: 2,3,4,5-tetrahydropyridine-2,6-dicarboxylate N-succinyltransferase [Bdellovibrionales bacterium]
MEIKTTIDKRKLYTLIEQAYDIAQKTNRIDGLEEKHHDAVDESIGAMDRGHLRSAEKIDGKWQVHEWVKKAILLYFRIRHPEVLDLNGLSFVDKIPVKQWKGNEAVRVVPPAVVRRGAYIGNNCVLMPSYVNIGAYVGDGTMVDTWATVGSCAQIGVGVHLSGGVGIGGVLEPLQASPVIVEDHAFVGSRCVIVEGVLIEEGAVIGAGVILTASTKIVDVTGEKPVASKGRIPKNSVVIPGMTSKEFKAGTAGVPCALIIGQRTDGTDKKTSLNQVLRDFDVSV